MNYLITLCLACFLLVSCNQEPRPSASINVDAFSFRGDHKGMNSSLSTGQNSSSEETLPVEAGTLTAGEWNDLNDWGFWQQLMQKEEWASYQTHWRFFMNEPYRVQWLDVTGAPVVDAPVTLKNIESDVIYWKARTNHKGEAVLWMEPFSDEQRISLPITRIEGTYKGRTYQVDAQPLKEGGNTLTLPQKAPSRAENLAEILFVVDATGSMLDEINYLNLELQSVVQNLAQQSPNLTLRLGSIFYRDHTDEYLMRKTDLTADMTTVFSFLSAQTADGGGDFPEAVDEALEEAIIGQEWSENATTRIVFLLLDAPPHHNAAAFERIEESLVLAAQKGIQIIPIASSGIDKETEFLMRAWAQLTNGTYTFITDHSGVGNGHIEPTVGVYSVEYLNDLLLRLLLERTKASTEVLQ